MLPPVPSRPVQGHPPRPQSSLARPATQPAQCLPCLSLPCLALSCLAFLPPPLSLSLFVPSSFLPVSANAALLCLFFLPNSWALTLPPFAHHSSLAGSTPVGVCTPISSAALRTRDSNKKKRLIDDGNSLVHF